MAAVGHTRAQLREEVARFFAAGRPFENTATGGTTTTLVDSKLTRFADDYFNGVTVFVKTDAGGANAAPQGESATCTDFVSSTGTLTIAPAMTAAPAAGDTYQLYYKVPKSEIDQALNRACIGARALATLTPSTTTLDYALTGTGLYRPAQIIAVWRRNLNDTQTLPYQLQGWQLEDNAGTLELRLPGLCNSTDGLWVEYLIGEDGLATDVAKVNLPVELVKARALVYLIENLLAGMDGQELQSWGSILREWKERMVLEQRAVGQPAGRARRFAWEWTQPGGSRAEQALGLNPNFGGDFSDYP